jgi:CheY-like chemotaxis protein
MKKVTISENILRSIGRSSSVFGRGGIAVHSSKTAEGVLAFHRTRKADLIIIDRVQPVMGGVPLCRTIRQDEKLRDVSIVLVSDATEASLSECRSAGANAVITSPVDAVALFSLMSELLVVPRRKDMRVLLRVSVSGGSNDASFFATSENISISGILLESNYRFKRNDQLSCSFFIGHSEVHLDGTVTRVDRAASGRHRYGVKFLNPTTKALVVIEQFVKSRQGPAQK